MYTTGIIIDTFAELRMGTKAKAEDVRSEVLRALQYLCSYTHTRTFRRCLVCALCATLSALRLTSCPRMASNAMSRYNQHLDPQSTHPPNHRMVMVIAQEDHYMWAYMYMFAHLAYKPRTEYTGVEEYLMDRVRGTHTLTPSTSHSPVLSVPQIQAKELSFFPVLRALCLGGNDGGVVAAGGAASQGSEGEETQ